MLQRARDGEPEKIPEFSGEKSDRLLAKQQIKDKRKAEKDATVPFWVETISVDMVNNTKAMNMYMTTFLEESKDAEDGSDDQFFETLNNLELSPEITVRISLPLSQLPLMQDSPGRPPREPHMIEECIRVGCDPAGNLQPKCAQESSVQYQHLIHGPDVIALQRL